ncbi:MULTISPECIES: glycine cleavage system protein GcvH [Vibrio]|uniref:Glycine cleavage system H protein n=2 Tax=Vibrio genomosp. F10 TaxID=723171 RepID=A0A1B9QZY9_9VIBR|nr:MULTISPECIES: glycine cleavage system protein GcvH [Vibrio]OCH76947.1 glycine cleavage system protein H [Vibrio genomosp. F10]OEE32700.1 glycine cleavage system protein H [Vibrio genomosp. F10 str. ZF-129]OEE94366.1 glycine cleavage system protein H [Vibrio genomosp. F10 str. 9ZC157]OEE96086.1 glycine cleavage system protein H [Vibrio genomosp. F10 str. 9ZD137]OEF05488.1 glycine cleavage system protein H [Vibrio genomosp. F10 str. 9ZB36]
MDNTLKFADSHEWVKDNGDGTVTIGISEHAQEMLGDVVFVDLPEADDEIEAGESFSLVESVKAASDIYAPVTGVIVEINEELEDSPELINEESYEGGWIVKVKLSDPSELDNLKDAEEYLNSIDDE